MRPVGSHAKTRSQSDNRGPECPRQDARGRLVNIRIQEHNLNASTIADTHIVGNALALFQGEQEEKENE